MSSRQYQLALFASLCLLASSTSTAQSVRIEIKSSWDGLGTPSHGDLVISGSESMYLVAGRAVNPKAVETLLAALDEPEIKEPSILNCGIGQAWLDSNYEAALQDYTHRKVRELSPKEIELFENHFTNGEDAQKAFAELFKSWHTDDYPKMSVTVTIDGTISGVGSESQHPFMLPWIGLDKTRGGYNCRISQAIAALLPKKFSNRGRLTLGEPFRWTLAAEVMRTIEVDWNLLDTEHLVGGQVAAVFDLYSPIESSVGCISSIDVDDCGWNATLRSSTLPPNMVIGVSLPYQNKKQLVGVQTFLKKLPRYSELVQSVPWLATFMADNPRTVFDLRYVGDRSLSAKAQSSLQEDLRKHGKGELADNISEVGQASAFLEVDCGFGCWSRVVVLPNRDVLLWHFKGNSVLGFSEQEFNTWDYYDWRGAGVLVKPDGTLMR